MTIIIIITTAIISILAFQRRDIFDELLLNPYHTFHKKQWHRMVTHGFVHAGGWHLAINMLVLLSFGRSLESTFQQLVAAGWIKNINLNYSLLYIGGIVISSLLTLFKHKDNPSYNSVGASGAVSAVVFTSIFFDPWGQIYLFGLIEIKSIIAGAAFLVYSYIMGRKGDGFINHDAHLLGAIYGFLFPVLVNHKMLEVFIYQLTN